MAHADEVRDKLRMACDGLADVDATLSAAESAPALPAAAIAEIADMRALLGSVRDRLAVCAASLPSHGAE